jgi:acyl carrier protein
MAEKNKAESIDVGRIRAGLPPADDSTIDPERLSLLAENCGYTDECRYAASGDPFRLDVVFRRSNCATDPSPHPAQAGFVHATRPWTDYGTEPLKAKVSREVVRQLRSFAEDRLPEYMQPSRYMILDRLPLGPNGKLDRAALPAPDQVRGDQPQQCVGPQTPIEERLVAIWREVLRLDQIGVHDDFFELGGHSLLATQITSRIRDAFQIALPLALLFAYPTIAALAAQIDQILVAKVEGLSEEEFCRLTPV